MYTFEQNKGREFIFFTSNKNILLLKVNYLKDGRLIINDDYNLYTAPKDRKHYKMPDVCYTWSRTNHITVGKDTYTYLNITEDEYDFISNHYTDEPIIY